MIVIGSQRHQRRFSRARLMAEVGAALASSLASAAQAQSSPAPVPPIHQAVDGNGVDTVLGTFNTSSTDVSIGQSARDGMAYTRYWSGYGGWRDSLAATLTGDSTYATVSIGGSSESFTNGVSDQGTGSSLTYNGVYTYTTSAGIVATFTPANGTYDRYVSNLGWATSIRYPDGTQWGYTYKAQNYCPYQPGDYEGTCPIARSVRLQSVTNNLGYQMKLTYKSNTLTNMDQVEDWQTVTKVTAINNAVEGCDPSADACSLNGSWPSATYSLTYTSAGATEDATDPLGRVKRYTYDTSGRITAIRRAGFSNDTTTVAYGDNGVSSATVAGVTTNYSYATPASDVQTITVTNALNQQSVISSAISTGLVTSVRDALSHTTYYAHDGSGRVTQVTAQEGNQVQYGYDSRGNVTMTTLVAKPGSGLANIGTSASYPTGCSTGVTCNKPTSTTDARGNVTSYTYDATHGGLTSVTSPAGANGVQPQTRYGYTSYNGIWRLTSTSTCRTQAACTGGADETRSTIAYTGTNLLATLMSSGAGDGSLTATNTLFYDNIGNVTAVDGPLPGSADTTNYYWDADRENTGIISPDPDGSGPLQRRAVSRSYVLDGLVGNVLVGTTASDGTNFQVLQTQAFAIDGNGRTVASTLSASGATYGVTHFSYDALGRPLCTAVRMNTGAWSNQTDACTLQATGGSGPDRITRILYDAVGRQSLVTAAYGTGDAANKAATAYTPNGLVSTQTDAMGNSTTYGYDGFDRRNAMYLPVPQQSAGASNGGDYEVYAYDAAGNMVAKRLRDGQTQSFTYDALGRLTSKVRPNHNTFWETDLRYAWDNQGHLVQASDGNNHTLGFVYDALGRQTSQSDAWYGTGNMTFQYDAAGRRTSQYWWDGFYVTYDYDVLGEMTAIHENGRTVLASFGNDDLGRRTTLSRANGTSTSYAYDAASRLTGLSLNGSPANSYSFSYNPAGQIASRTSSNDAYAWTGAVNANRAYTTNGLNQYTQSGSTAIGYDTRGNLSTSGSSSYGYTTDNQLATSPSTNLGYDALGRLFNITSDGGRNTTLGYEGDRVLTEIDQSNGSLLRRYVYGPGTDEPLVWYEGSGTSDRRFLHADERGSVVAVTDNAGNISAINTYDEYGIPGANNQGRFQYTGQKWLPALGMYDYKARTYSPTLGRFLQTDPIGYSDGMNWYAYAHGDPVNRNDPSGHKTKLPSKPEPTYTGSIIPGHIAPYLFIDGVDTGQAIVNAGYGASSTSPSTPADGLVHGGNEDGNPAKNYKFSSNPNDITEETQVDGTFGHYEGNPQSGARFVPDFNLLKNEFYLGTALSGIGTPSAIADAGAVYAADGTLTADAISSSRMIVPNSRLGNPNIPAGFDKYTTQVFSNPSQAAQARFYMNSETGEIYYGLDYKTQFTRPFGK